MITFVVFIQGMLHRVAHRVLELTKCDLIFLVKTADSRYRIDRRTRYPFHASGNKLRWNEKSFDMPVEVEFWIARAVLAAQHIDAHFAEQLFHSLLHGYYFSNLKDYIKAELEDFRY